MAAGHVTLSFPMYAIALEATPQPNTGMNRYRGLHARLAEIDGPPENCLMLFATIDSATEYAAGRESLAQAHIVTITDKLELETVLADCREVGVKFVMIATGMPQQGIASIDDLASGLDAIDHI